MGPRGNRGAFRLAGLPLRGAMAVPTVPLNEGEVPSWYAKFALALPELWGSTMNAACAVAASIATRATNSVWQRRWVGGVTRRRLFLRPP